MSIPAFIQSCSLGLLIAGLATGVRGLPLTPREANGAPGVLQRAQWPPPDVAASDPELAQLRDRLRAIVERRDVEQLTALMGPVIRFDFEEHTPAAFIAMVSTWQSELLDDFWCDLRDALELAMARDEGYVYAPYVATVNHELVVVSERVALRVDPAPRAKVIAWLTYGPIERASDDAWDTRQPATIGGYRYGWHRVRTASDTTGWASAKFVRSPTDARLLFERVDGRWKLWGIARGD